ncbi:MAG: YggS family pyridoxal phosphate-dependent enzyme [Deltaproteobacteria bacterium]|nr:YggS family pyridoxal phosphate-dependent enzyme [Nannocystaceae bacterium]
MSTLVHRLAEIHGRIAAARLRGENQEVRLVAVSKKQPVAAITEAIAAGVRELGENYAQELGEKRGALPDPSLRWHMIGPVQRNKVKLVVGCALLHSVDRPELLDAIESRARALAIVQDVLVQVNVVGEPGKSGVAPEALPDLLDRFADLGHVRCTGLMLIPPLGTPDETRACFAGLRSLRDHHGGAARPGVELAELSMGMSGDYELAIEHGATFVRVGTALFGARA